MGRQLGVIALIFVATVGLASAQNQRAPGSAPAPTVSATTNPPTANAPNPNVPATSIPPRSPPTPKAAAPATDPPLTETATSPAEAPTTNDTMPDIALPAPVGSETQTDAPPESGATVLRVSAVVAGVAVAGFFY